MLGSALLVKVQVQVDGFVFLFRYIMGCTCTQYLVLLCKLGIVNLLLPVLYVVSCRTKMEGVLDEQFYLDHAPDHNRGQTS